jgi:hypothetical protein
VAEADGKWMAILTFSGAAPHLKAREKWFGWSPRQRARRLGFLINNSRFLLLVERERHPNLVSKVLPDSRRLPVHGKTDETALGWVRKVFPLNFRGCTGRKQNVNDPPKHNFPSGGGGVWKTPGMSRA